MVAGQTDQPVFDRNVMGSRVGVSLSERPRGIVDDGSEMRRPAGLKTKSTILPGRIELLPDLLTFAADTKVAFIGHAAWQLCRAIESPNSLHILGILIWKINIEWGSQRRWRWFLNTWPRISSTFDWRLMRFLGTVLIFFLFVGSGVHAEPARVMGWVEPVEILPSGLKIFAKLDTGASTSSIDAARYEEFKRAGKTWVRFDVLDRKGGSFRFERPVVRVSRIRRSDAPTVIRPVIELGVCLGGVYRKTQVNLADRAHLSHPMLIGRRFLKAKILVDPSRKLTSEPRCAKQSSN